MDSILLLAAAEGAGENTEGTVITPAPAVPANPAAETGTKADGSPAGADTPPVNPPKANPLMTALPFVLLFVLMYMMLFRGPRKQKQEHQKLVASLKKNDRVRTIGGILGVVLDVKDDEVVLKVDESTNTKIRVIPSAIATVLSGEKN